MARPSLPDTVTTSSVSGRFVILRIFRSILKLSFLEKDQNVVNLLSDITVFLLMPELSISFLPKQMILHHLYVFLTRCLLLAPGRSPATKKSPALPLLKKKYRRKMSWPCVRSARCTVRSKLYVHIVLFALCAYAALPEFCGCNLNKLEGQNFLYLLAVHNR